MKADEHHPSCTPNDRSLVWHCSQCGAIESAADEEQLLEIRDQTIIQYKRELAAEQANAEKAAARAELAQIQLAQTREILKACESFAEAWAAEDLLDRIRDALMKQ
jgi:hypothetical protein